MCFAGYNIKAPSAFVDARPDVSNNALRSARCESGSGLQDRNWRHRENSSDRLELTFALTPKLNQTVTVQLDGYISSRAVGDLLAAGQTLPELTESTKTAYYKISRDLEITVDAKDFEKPHFTVGGQGAKPRKFDLNSDITPTQTVARGEGLTDVSKHLQVLLFRRVQDQWTVAV